MHSEPRGGRTIRTIRNSAKALIIRDGCLLALRMADEAGEFFILPGGGQEPGEALAETAHRECREELGAEIMVQELRYVREYLGDLPHRVEFIFNCTLVPGSPLGGGSLPDVGQVGLVWLPLAELTNLRFYPSGLRAPLADPSLADEAVYLGVLD
jgi:8-oxo-dGTP diphosphatase